MHVFWKCRALSRGLCILSAEPILQLAINILGVGSIMVSLLDGQKKFVVKSAAGFVPPETMLTPPGICHWSLVPQVHQMVVIEDTLLDARCSFLGWMPTPGQGVACLGGNLIVGHAPQAWLQGANCPLNPLAVLGSVGGACCV